MTSSIGFLLCLTSGILMFVLQICLYRKSRTMSYFNKKWKIISITTMVLSVMRSLIIIWASLASIWLLVILLYKYGKESGNKSIIVIGIISTVNSVIMVLLFGTLGIGFQGIILPIVLIVLVCGGARSRRPRMGRAYLDQDAAVPTKTCPQCGKTVPGDKKFCRFCGAMIEEATTEADTQESADANDIITS